MTLYFSGFALLSAIIWGITPTISKRALSDGGSFFQGTYIIVSVCTVIYWSLLLMLHGIPFVHFTISTQTLLLFTVSGLVGTAIGRLNAIQGIHKTGASVSNSVVAIQPLFSALLAVILLNERVTLCLGAGIIILVLGLILLARSRGGDVKGWNLSDLAYPATAALCFGFGSILRRYGLTETEASPLLGAMINETTALLSLTIFILTSQRINEFRTTLKVHAYFALDGIGTALALLSLFYALHSNPVVQVDPIVATAPLFTVIFSFTFLRDLERITGKLVVGAILIVSGGILIITA